MPRHLVIPRLLGALFWWEGLLYILKPKHACWQKPSIFRNMFVAAWRVDAWTSKLDFDCRFKILPTYPLTYTVLSLTYEILSKYFLRLKNSVFFLHPIAPVMATTSVHSQTGGTGWLQYLIVPFSNLLSMYLPSTAQESIHTFQLHGSLALFA